MLRTALLGGNSITLDADLSKYIETLSEQGIIEGLEVSSGSVAPGKAWVKATRSNGETIMVLVQNSEAISITTTGTKKVWLEIKQEAIDNGALNNEDGTGIAELKTGPSVPSQNSLLLANVTNGNVEDKRAIIPKVQSLASRASTLENWKNTASSQIATLTEAATPNHLAKKVRVGEAYQMGDVLFERDGRAYKKSIRAIKDSWNRSGYASTFECLSFWEIILPEGKNFRLVADSMVLNENARVELYIGDVFHSSNGGANGYKYGIVRDITATSYASGLSFHLNQGMETFTGGKICLTFFVRDNLRSIQVSNFRIEGETESGDAILLYPREVKGVDEIVECTTMGLHTDGQRKDPIPKKVPLLINQTVSGNRISSTWTAPSDGFLSVVISGGLENGGIRIQRQPIHFKHGGGTENLTHLIFVRRGPVEVNFNEGSATVLLKEFIPY